MMYNKLDSYFFGKYILLTKTNVCSIIVIVRNEKAYRFTGVGAPPR